MKIAFDMDGVMFDLHNPWVELHNSHFVKPGETPLSLDNIKDWEMRTAPLSCTFEQMMKLLETPGLFKNLKPIGNIIQVINKLIEEKHDVHVFTACVTLLSFEEKVMSILKYIPQLERKIIAVMSSEAKVALAPIFDIIVEDNPHTLAKIGNNKPANTFRILMSAPYNLESPSYEYDARVYTSDEIYSTITSYVEKTTQNVFHLHKCFVCVSNNSLDYNPIDRRYTCPFCATTEQDTKWNSRQQKEKRLRLLSLVESTGSLDEAKKIMQQLIKEELNGDEYVHITTIPEQVVKK